MNYPTFKAKSAEELETMKAKLNTLSSKVVEQIETVEKNAIGEGLICHLYDNSFTAQVIYLPKKGVERINESNGMITIIFDNHKFVLKIKRADNDVRLEFIE
jgi:hypothetical protein